MLLLYRVKVSATKVTHFTSILALCTCLYRSNLRKTVSMKQTKHSRKSEAQNLRSKCPQFTRIHTFHSNDYTTAQSLMVSVAVSSLGAIRSCTSWNHGLRSTVTIIGIQFCWICFCRISALFSGITTFFSKIGHRHIVHVTLSPCCRQRRQANIWADHYILYN